MIYLRNVHALLRGGLTPAGNGHRGVAGSTGQPPASQRLREILHKQDVNGERAVAIAQGTIALFVLILHVSAQFDSALPLGNPWVVLALAGLVATSALRLFLTSAQRL